MRLFYVYILEAVNGLLRLFHLLGPEYRLSDDRRLSVRIDSTWSTVCADGLTAEDARVACKSLNRPW